MKGITFGSNEKRGNRRVNGWSLLPLEQFSGKQVLQAASAVCVGGGA